MKRLTLIILTFLSVTAMAQVQFYKGNSSYSSDVLYTFDGKSIYKGRSTYSSDILYTFDGTYIYRGRSTYSSDILFTVSKGHIYRGKSTYSTDILYSFDGMLPIPILLLMM